MKKHLSLTVQMVYVAITGLQLIFVPNILLGLLGLPTTNEIWIRILGIIVFILAILYRSILNFGTKEVIKATILTRLVAAIGIILLAFWSGMPILIIFASVDVATAIWTWFEMK